MDRQCVHYATTPLFVAAQQGHVYVVGAPSSMSFNHGICSLKTLSNGLVSSWGHRGQFRRADAPVKSHIVRRKVEDAFHEPGVVAELQLREHALRYKVLRLRGVLKDRTNYIATPGWLQTEGFMPTHCHVELVIPKGFLHRVSNDT